MLGISDKVIIWTSTVFGMVVDVDMDTVDTVDTVDVVVVDVVMDLVVAPMIGNRMAPTCRTVTT